MIAVVSGEPPKHTHVNQVLEALGGTWDRKAKTHVFPTEPGPLVARVLADGQVTPPELNPHSFVPTPVQLAADVAEEIGLLPEHRLLEPSCGEGALVLPLLRIRMRRLGLSGADADLFVPSKDKLLLVEIDPARIKALDARLRPNVVQDDFLRLSPGVLGTFDRIAMNPPFEKDQDALHIERAAKLLRPGGRLVAIAGDGFRWRERGHAPKVRAALSEQGRLRLKELPSDTFLGTGVSVRTCLVVFDKPAA